MSDAASLHIYTVILKYIKNLKDFSIILANLFSQPGQATRDISMPLTGGANLEVECSVLRILPRCQALVRR